MIEILNKYHYDGLVYKQVHPTLPLIIWNYTPHTQYNNLWDEITLQCRGLVTDNNGIVVARPFKKFFNQEEGKHTPTQDFEVFEKLDGSLGIVFNYKGEWIIATRGSFTSDQAIKGKEMLGRLDISKLPKNLTYLFEILYFENRIVVQYPEEKLVLLGAIDVDSTEVSRHTLEYFAKEIGSDIAKSYDGVKDYNLLKGMVKDNEEGFVVKFSNGDRIKIKGTEYLRLHKIMTEVSTTSIWEMLSSGQDIEELLKEVPDEFYNKIKSHVNELLMKFDNLKKEYEWIFKTINSIESTNDRAVFAYYTKRYKHPFVLFSMADGKNVDEIIWRIIKPEFKKL